MGDVVLRVVPINMSAILVEILLTGQVLYTAAMTPTKLMHKCIIYLVTCITRKSLMINIYGVICPCTSCPPNAKEFS